MTLNDKPSWFNIPNLVAGINVTIVAIGFIVWFSGKAISVDQAHIDLITVNARLDRIFEKLDALPVLVEKVHNAESQITEARGAYSTLDIRLRAIENNNAANHADIEAVAKPKPRSN